MRAFALIVLMFFLYSCASYNQRINNYYDYVKRNEYQKANAALDKNKILQARRNRLLYLLEKGKMAHLLKQYDISNKYFNEADLYMEDVRTSAKDIVAGTLINPMMKAYKGEDFEKYMVHYYKALNYLYTGKPDDAIVEARRISLRTYVQLDKINNPNHYSADAFSHILQGIIYEQGNDLNNAFIAYRNAADLFLKNNHLFYGVQMPEQLKKDLLQTATQLGFTDEASRYQKLLNISPSFEQNGEGGELILFWENGLAPVKREQNFVFTLTKDGTGNFVFTDPNGAYNIPFDFSACSTTDKDAIQLSDIHSLRIAYPRYEEQPLYYGMASLNTNQNNYRLETASDINALAVSTLKERFIKELSFTLSRLAVKKIIEQSVKPKDDDKNKMEKQALSFALQIFNFTSEKADTRNWQTLPHTIFYTRIPLQKGTNLIQLSLTGHYKTPKTIDFSIEGTGKIQVHNLCLLN